MTRGVYCPGRLKLAPDRLITGIAHLLNIAQIKVELPADDKAKETELFEALAQVGISIDLINVFPEMKIFTIPESDLPTAQQRLAQAGFKATMTQGLAKVSVVGAGMRGVPGVMARIVNAKWCRGRDSPDCRLARNHFLSGKGGGYPKGPLCPA